jgi:microcystin-dependent protein
MDQMPGGTRANRLTRSVAIILAGKAGEETHVITVPEMPAHSHPVTDPGHAHTFLYGDRGSGAFGVPPGQTYIPTDQFTINAAVTGISIQNTGNNGAHENLQPTVFVPYIVYLDG